ncbi:MAG: hypothetical protein PHY54_01565 [Methylococcales bacterium]|nr:hypothetical protein [Methylococcales bacterium]
MWFNPAELSKIQTKPLATPATPATFEPENIKPEAQSRKVAEVAEGESESVEWIEYVEPDPDDPMTVTCFTPNGGKILVKARDEKHKALLMAWNPGTAH